MGHLPNFLYIGTSKAGSTWIYDVEMDDWTEGPSLVGTRSQFLLAQRGEELWVFGGVEFDPSQPRESQFSHPTEVLRWDGESERTSCGY